MDEKTIKAACRSYDEQRLERLMQTLDAAPAHTFSRRYEKRKQAILRRYESYSPGQNRLHGHRLSKKTVRVLLAAALLLLLLLGTALAFEPVRHYIFTYFDGTDIIFRDDGRKDSLKETFTYIPEGYVLEEEKHSKESNYYLYRDKNKNKMSIYTEINGGSVFINTEDVNYTEVDIQGFTGYYVERSDGLILTWTTGKYSHTIGADFNSTTNLTKAEILKIATSRILE